MGRAARLLRSADVESLRERFNARAVRSEGCWLWDGEDTRRYGKLSVGPRPARDISVHRLAFALFKGDVPADANVLHDCDVKSCVNPGHLHLGTHKDNTQEALARGRLTTGDAHWTRLRPDDRLRGSAAGNARYSEDDVRRMHAMRADGLRPVDIAKQFNGANSTHIGRILRGEAWAHVPAGAAARQPMHTERGEERYNARLTAEIVRAARNARLSGPALAAEARRLGVSNATLHSAVTGRTWKHVGANETGVQEEGDAAPQGREPGAD